MAIRTILSLLSLYFIVVNCVDPALEDEEVRGWHFLKYLNDRSEKRHLRSGEAQWTYTSNLTEYNLKKKIEVETEVANETKQDWNEINKFHWRSFRDPDLKRQFKMNSILGAAALPTKKFEKFTKIVSDMEKIYSTAKICDYYNASKCDLALEPEITDIIEKSRNPDELKHLWVQWRNAVGPKVKDMYETYVELSNEAARLNSYSDNTEALLDDFESDDIREQFHNLWEQVKPLYMQIHAYVRHKLRLKYGDDVVSEKGPIPAHLLGNMWAQTWNHVEDLTLPYPDAPIANVTEEMLKQGYTIDKMFHLAESFFTSLNLSAMPETFWQKSVLEKPTDGREIVCHPSAWDFYNGDARIKMCTKITEEHLGVAHHEMGHVQYYLLYANQPVAYREGANSGFHEAVGDTIALSASTTKHLQKIGLAKKSSLDEKTVQNLLFKKGLEKIAFLPFGYLLDLWRWDVFSGNISKENWNCKYWEFRHEYQGVEPPVDRSEDDFDPSSKYHTVADIPYIRYFVSFIIQFQFHKALCLKAGQYDPNDPEKPLFNCDIYQNTEAGNALGDMLAMGSSKPWPDAMEALTGQRNMDATGLLDYFKPLQTWLEEENRNNGAFIGWEPTKRVCTSAKAEQ